MTNSPLSIILAAFATVASGPRCFSQQATSSYASADDSLKTTLIDSSDTESFLALRLDTAGRLFSGGREALFVHEPDGPGGFKKREEVYRFPAHTWVYDIAFRGDDVYVTTVSALYVIPNARVRRNGLAARRLVWGIPLGHVHQCFHSLAWGPEGDLYFTTGDPTWYLLNVERPDHWGYWTYFSQPEGTRTPYNGVGGVFRVRPDGSDLRIVATGVRNACGMVFDSNWNLFINDNDHEGAPAQYVPGKLVEITPGCDVGWPRGWMLHKTPDRRDILQTMFTGMGRGIPVGQTYYDEPLFPSRYRNNLLVARWGARMVGRYPLRPRGSSFKTDEFRVLNGRGLVRPVGVGVGPRGRVFAALSYMAHNEGSPTYRSDLVMMTPRGSTAGTDYEPYEATSASADRLYAELSSDSWVRRHNAHVEITRRGGDTLKLAVQRFTEASASARAHLCHLMAVAADKESSERIRELLAHEDAAIRLQAHRALAEHAALGGTVEHFVRGLSDSSPQIQLVSLTGLKRLGVTPDALLTAATSEDSYLRQSATILLAEKASLEMLQGLCQSKDSKKRLAGILAVGRRLTMRPPFSELPNEVPLGIPRGLKIQFDREKVDLREFGRIGTYRMADFWKHVKHSQEQEQLFELLAKALADEDAINRLQSAQLLHVLNDDRANLLIQQVRQQSVDARLAKAEWQTVDGAWIVGPFTERLTEGGDELFGEPNEPELRPVDLSAEFVVASDRKVAWKKIEVDASGEIALAQQFDGTSQSSVYAYFLLESSREQRVHFRFGKESWVKVWRNGEIVWKTPRWIRDRRENSPQEYVTVDLHAGTNAVLVRVLHRTKQPPLTLAVRSLESVYVTVPEPEDQEFASRLASAASGDVDVPKSFLSVDWNTESDDGDPERGSRLFVSIGCSKCHAVSNDSAVGGGPSLAESRKRFTPAYIAESVLLPSKLVSPAFKSSTMVTADGQVIDGLVVRETPDQVEVVLSDGKRRTVATKAIVRRLENKLSIMPAGLVKQPQELKDLLSYLLAPESSNR